MSEIAELLKTKYQDRLNGELESYAIDELNGLKIYWKPLTGRQQKVIQKAAVNSTAEGICMHVKSRALDEKKELIFKDIALIGLMNDYEFNDITKIFFAMTGSDFSVDDIEKN
jgi:hypothetical protein